MIEIDNSYVEWFVTRQDYSPLPNNSYYTEEQRRVNVYFERKLEFVLSYLTPTLSLSLSSKFSNRLIFSIPFRIRKPGYTLSRRSAVERDFVPCWTTTRAKACVIPSALGWIVTREKTRRPCFERIGTNIWDNLGVDVGSLSEDRNGKGGGSRWNFG